MNLAKCPAVPPHRDGTVGQSAQFSVKALARSVLAASKPVPANDSSGTLRGTVSTSVYPHVERKPEVRGAGLAACRSADCAGCYVVAPGVQIHPPKCGDEYRAWLESWEAKGKPQ